MAKIINYKDIKKQNQFGMPQPNGYSGQSGLAMPNIGAPTNQPANVGTIGSPQPRQVEPQAPVATFGQTPTPKQAIGQPVTANKIPIMPRTDSFDYQQSPLSGVTQNIDALTRTAGDITRTAGETTQSAIDAARNSAAEALRVAPTDPLSTTDPVGGYVDSGPLPTPRETPLIDAGPEAEKLLTEQVLADARGESTEVTAARDRLDREKTLRLNDAQRMAHDRAVQAGYRPGTPQYEQMMRSGMSDAQAKNIEAENRLNEFARSTRYGVRDDLANIGEGAFGRERLLEQDAMSKFNNFVKFLPTDKAQEMAAINEITGGEFSGFVSGLYDAEGNLKPEFKGETGVDKIIGGIREMANKITINPTTNQPWVNDAEKETWINTTAAETFKQTISPMTEESRRQTDIEDSRARFDEFVKTGDSSKLSPQDWEQATTTQLNELNLETVDDTKSYLRLGDWEKSGLKADKVAEQVDDREWEQDSSAGDGKGSIVMYKDKPYRITLYRTKKDTTGTNERMGEYILSPADGKGEDVTISTGWKDI